MTTSTIQEAFDDAMRYIDSLLDIAKKHNERFASLEKRVKELEETEYKRNQLETFRKGR